MKSDNGQLKKRGYIQETDLKNIAGKTDQELLSFLSDKEPWKRTAAVRVLSEGLMDDADYCDKLLNMLQKEKALYTKIEICQSLQKGSRKTAEKMINYLGEIGKNQYKELPSESSRKKSYPLPRDIIARTLGNMDKEILPVLMNVLKEDNLTKIAEIIDAIGFMIFYNPQLATGENLEEISNVMKRYEGNKLITWKCITCLSSFKLPESLDLLNRIKEEINDENNILYKEAERSIKIINDSIMR